MVKEYAKKQNKEQCDRFKARLRTQDRNSGDKIWLPLDEIARIFNPNKNSKSNQFTYWLKELSENVYVHYLDDNKVNSIQFKDCNGTVYLKLVESQKDGEGTGMKEVKVVIGDKEYPALTPIGKGNKKEIMTVEKFEDIVIDHVIPIDKTLRKLGEQGNLQELKKVSERCWENNTGEENTDTSDNIDTRKLLDELVEIGNHSPLRLMTKKYNSQKSNEDTYIKVFVKNEGTEEDKYFGIIKENVIDYNDHDKKYFLCQVLSNSFRCCNKTEEFIVGSTFFEQAKEKALSDCIDYI
jgi:hypothetical protein